MLRALQVPKMAENKQEPRQLKKPGHEDRQTERQRDRQRGSERGAGRGDGEKVRRREDKLAVVKWRMGALWETSEVEGGGGGRKNGGFKGALR